MAAGLSRAGARRALASACLVALAGTAGCGSSAPEKHGGKAPSGTETLTVRVTSPPDRTTDADCRFRLTGPLDDGGKQDVCLSTVDGFPAAGATTTAHGVLTIDEPDGSLTADVTVTQTFAADGQHASQEMSGHVTGGRGDRFSGWHGAATGTGQLVDTASGISSIDLTWTFTSG